MYSLQCKNSCDTISKRSFLTENKDGTVKKRKLYMRNRKNCLAVLLMTTIVVMGCGNQQVEKGESIGCLRKSIQCQDESEDGEKKFLSTYQNIIITHFRRLECNER